MPFRPARSAYPISWRVLDALEAAARLLWPARMAPLLPWLILLPAILLVGLLVLGLVETADSSLRTLDTNTFLPSEDRSLANYARAASEPLFLVVGLRSLGGALLVTLATLVLAFPYAYAMVRTPSAAWRKTLLVALFLPFFIGQVVRAYGWLILLGNQGLANELLGLAGLGPYRFLFNYWAVLFGLVQYMLPFAVLMLAPALTAIPEEVEAAAGSLGANGWRTLLHVVMPMAKPGFIGAGLVVLTLSLTDFAIPAILGGGRQDFIANAIYDQFFRISDAGMGSALTLLLVLVGSTLAGTVFALFGAGTMALKGGRT